MTPDLPLPDRVSALAELPDPSDGVLYQPDGAGFRLRHEVVTLYAEHDARVAEIEAEIASLHKQRRRLAVRGAVRAALVEAGADRGLLDAAVLVFGAQHELKVEGDLVSLDDPVSVSSIAFAAGAWLEGPGKAYRDKSRRPTADGYFVRQLAAIIQ